MVMTSLSVDSEEETSLDLQDGAPSVEEDSLGPGLELHAFKRERISQLF